MLHALERVARELASHLRLKQNPRELQHLLRHVARELASHLRLKQDVEWFITRDTPGGAGTGFSSEIETRRARAHEELDMRWRGNWLLI